MNIRRSQKLLKKINSMFQSIHDDADELSALELQLLKDYVVQLYDSLIESNDIIESNGLSIRPANKNSDQVSRPTNYNQPSNAGPRPTPVDEMDVKPVHRDTKHIEPEVEANEVKHVEEQVEEQVENLLDPFFSEIEQMQVHTHMGERIVTDLRKSMGLNDKLLFSNLLFGGNQDDLKKILDELNEENNIDSVKTRLNKVASEHNWIQENKQKAVAEFIRLVFKKFSTPA